jgi:nucleotide-binding universal stress UspA family protein
MAGVIVVGVDGSRHSLEALTWAAEETKLRNATLRIVHGWSFHDLTVAVETSSDINIEEAARSVVDQARAAVDRAVHVETEISNDMPAELLIRQSKGADLLVVGSRGNGGFKGLLVGSVSDQCLHHARCPVVVVRSSEA